MSEPITPEIVPETLEFDLTPKEINVRLKNKDGTCTDYVLREATGLAVERRRDAILENVQFGARGRPERMTKVASTESVLISECLYAKRQDKDGNEQLLKVPPATIRSWPSRVQKALFDQIKAMSELDIEDDSEESLVEQIEDLQERLDRIRENRAKNSPIGTTDGSDLPATMDIPALYGN